LLAPGRVLLGKEGTAQRGAHAEVERVLAVRRPTETRTGSPMPVRLKESTRVAARLSKLVD
jgi:hypothetical protein